MQSEDVNERVFEATDCTCKKQQCEMQATRVTSSAEAGKSSSFVVSKGDRSVTLAVLKQGGVNRHCAIHVPRYDRGHGRRYR